MAKTKLEIVKITPTPPAHEAVLLTDKNFKKVAKWLGGEVTVQYSTMMDPIYTFRFPKGYNSWGPLGELSLNAGLYIIKPARERSGAFPDPFVLGAVAYDTFFTVVED